jgi:hypothetical protein
MSTRAHCKVQRMCGRHVKRRDRLHKLLQVGFRKSVSTHANGLAHLLSVVQTNCTGSNARQQGGLPVVEPGDAAFLTAGARVILQRVVHLQ